MVAIFVLSLVLGMAFKSVNALSGVKFSLDKEEAALIAVQKSISILSRDISRAVEVKLAGDTNDSRAEQDSLVADTSASKEERLFELTGADGKNYAYSSYEGALFKQALAHNDPKDNEGNAVRLLNGLLGATFERPDLGEGAAQNWVQLTLEHETLGTLSRVISYTQLSVDLMRGVDSLPLSVNAGQTQTQVGNPQAASPQNAANPKNDEFDW